MFAFPGKKGNYEFNFCVCKWLYVVCKWLTHLLRSFKCDYGKNSQFPIIRLSHLKSVLRYIIIYRIAGNFRGGANFRYFRDYPASHEIFYPRIFPPTNFQSVIDVIRVSGFRSHEI